MIIALFVFTVTLAGPTDLTCADFIDGKTVCVEHLDIDPPLDHVFRSDFETPPWFVCCDPKERSDET